MLEALHTSWTDRGLFPASALVCAPVDYRNQIKEGRE